MSEKRKRICPHCGKEIKPKPIIKKIHWKKSPCGCYTINCPSSNDEEKVNCLNCIHKISEFREGWLKDCPKCGFVYNRWDFKNMKFCKECGYNLVER